MTVEELMNKSVVSVPPEETASLAARLLQRHNIGALPVCGEDGRLKGIVTDRDIVTRCIAVEDEPGETQVKDIMSRSVMTARPNEDIREAVSRMAEKQIRRLPVVQEGKLVGMLSLGDIAKAGRCTMEAARALTEISSNIRRKN